MATATKPRFNEAEAFEYLGQLSRSETQLGYDATENKGRRRMVTANTVSEDRELQSGKRRQLQASARDLARNFAIASWMIRKHLDFVSRFNFDCSSGVDAFDKQLEALMEEDSQKENFDIAGRHDRNRFMRLFEARACVDGDILAVMLKSGHRQAIESDRIRSKNGIDSEEITQGVRTNSASRAIGYQIHRRQAFGGFVFEREVAAENCMFHGYFDRFDQVRGISPMASGINSLQDVYENFDYALAKAKISQLFGLKFTRDGDQPPANLEEEVSEDVAGGPRYKIDFGRGPVSLDLNVGDDVDILESKNPSSEFQNFTMAMIMVALKSLDIPFCFYDESHTNFYGSRAAVTLYIESCKVKRDQLKRILKQMTSWKVRQWVAAGRLVLPAGMNVENCPGDWIHAGMPWWDPAKDINAANQAVLGGFRSHREVRKEAFGDDWFKVIDDLAEEQEYAAKKGVILNSIVLPQMEDPAANDVPGKKPKPKESGVAK